MFPFSLSWWRKVLYTQMRLQTKPSGGTCSLLFPVTVRDDGQLPGVLTDNVLNKSHQAEDECAGVICGSRCQKANQVHQWWACRNIRLSSTRRPVFITHYLKCSVTLIDWTLRRGCFTATAIGNALRIKQIVFYYFGGYSVFVTLFYVNCTFVSVNQYSE